MKLHVLFLEMQPLVAALITFLTVITAFFFLKIALALVQLFLDIFNYYRTREEMKKFSGMLIDEISKKQ